MPQVGEIWEGYKSTEFQLIVNGSPSPGFTRVAGLSEGTYDTIEQPDGGGTHVNKVSSTKIKYETLTLERRMDGSENDQLFKDWWIETFDFANKVSRGSRVRRNFQILKLDNGTPVLMFLVFGGWIKSSKFSDLEAGSDNFFTQTIEIEHEGLERVPPS
ncbi:MAG: phage tail protein [Sphingomonas sp.]